MSIVKQLVDLAGGTIEIRSHLGRGTQVKLSLPLENHLGPLGDDIATSISPSILTEDPIWTARRRAQGRTVILQGFDTYSGATCLQSQSLASLEASIRKYICDWFDLRIISYESSSNTAADIVISDESAFLNSPSTTVNELSGHGQALLILCSSKARDRMYAATLKSNRTIELISKPCGPRRLAKALLSCLDKENISRSNPRKASLRYFEASAQEEEPKSSDGGTLHWGTRSGDEVITAEKLRDITGPQSSKKSPLLVMSLSMTLREDVNKGGTSAVLSPNQSSEADMKHASSATKSTTASSPGKSGSRHTAPNSSAKSTTGRPFPNPLSSDLFMDKNQPLARRKMLLVEVRTALQLSDSLAQ
jgi:hypothetical protein